MEKIIRLISKVTPIQSRIVIEYISYLFMQIIYAAKHVKRIDLELI